MDLQGFDPFELVEKDPIQGGSEQQQTTVAVAVAKKKKNARSGAIQQPHRRANLSSSVCVCVRGYASVTISGDPPRRTELSENLFLCVSDTV